MNLISGSESHTLLGKQNLHSSCLVSPAAGMVRASLSAGVVLSLAPALLVDSVLSGLLLEQL